MRSPGAGAGAGAGASDSRSLSVTNDADPAGDRGEGSGVGTVLSYFTGIGEEGGDGGGSITSEPVQGPA